MPDTSLLSSRHWALQPEYLQALPSALSGAGPAPGPDGAPFTLDGPLALVRISGVLSRGSRLGTGFDQITGAVAAALDDPRAAAVVLVIDSPGGTVAGTQEAAAFLRRAGNIKPLYAYVDGLMASAAFWLGSAAGHIAAPETAEIGSIGVLSIHTDWSAWNQRQGLAFTYLTAGEFKASGNPDHPLGESDRQYLQQRLQGIYEIFLREAARGRGLDPEDLRRTQAKVLLAAEARQQGLIDQVVGSLDEYLSQIKEQLQMTLEELRAGHPELVEALESAATLGMVSAETLDQRLEQAASEASAQAAQAERTRVLDLLRGVLGAETAQAVEKLVSSGATAGQVEAVAALLGSAKPQGPESGATARMLAAIESAGAPPLQPMAQAPEGDFRQMVDDYRAEHGCSIAEAQRVVARNHPDKHKAYLKQANQNKE